MMENGTSYQQPEIAESAILEDAHLQKPDSFGNDLEIIDPSQTNVTTALQELHKQIEAVRKEAFAEGYHSAVRDMLREMNKFQSNAQPVQVSPEHYSHSAKAEKPPREKKAKRAPHGQNRKFVFEMMRTVAGKPITAIEIQNWIEENKGKRIPYVSIRHALDQLEKLGNVSRSDDEGRWTTLAKPKTSPATDGKVSGQGVATPQPAMADGYR